MMEGELLKKDENKKYMSKLNLLFFKAISEDCPSIEDLEEFLFNFTRKTGDNFKVIESQTPEFKELSEKYNLEYFPATMYQEQENIRLFGDVRGELEIVLEFFREYLENKPPIKPETKEFLDSLEEKIEINIFSTNMCPACPVMIDVALKVAINSNGKIVLNVFNVMNFRSFVDKYSIMAVPFVVCSNGASWVGVKTESKLIEELRSR